MMKDTMGLDVAFLNHAQKKSEETLRKAVESVYRRICGLYPKKLENSYPCSEQASVASSENPVPLFFITTSISMDILRIVSG